METSSGRAPLSALARVLATGARDPRIVLSILLVVGACLLFTRLDDRYLWDDEAETALLARNVLRFGVPVAWDGRDLISQECGTDYGANYLWRQTPWLPAYVMAASFALLGESTWSARLPFALLGLASLASVYLLGLRVFRDRAVALLAVLALTCSVPFLLYARQGRYYALAIFATVCVVHAFFAVLAGSRLAIAGLALGFTALFHSSHLAAAGMSAGLAAALVIQRPDRAAVERVAAAALAAAAFNGPWLALAGLDGKSALASSLFSTSAMALRTIDYLRWSELYVFPAVLLGPLLGWSSWRQRAYGVPAGLRPALALTAIVVLNIAVASVVPWHFFRYLVPLLPVFALLTAWVIRNVGRSSVAVAAIAFALVVSVDRADAVRASVGSPLVKYVGEIMHEFQGPIEAIVRHLRAEGRSGDRVFISYGDLPLRFYSDLDVRGGQGCEASVLTPLPEWIVVRYFFRFSNPAPGSAEDAARVAGALRDDVPWHRYRRIDLATVDTRWENIPEPEWHVYRTPVAGPRLSIYRRDRQTSAARPGVMP